MKRKTRAMGFQRHLFSQILCSKGYVCKIRAFQRKYISACPLPDCMWCHFLTRSTCVTSQLMLHLQCGQKSFSHGSPWIIYPYTILTLAFKISEKLLLLEARLPQIISTSKLAVSLCYFNFKERSTYVSNYQVPSWLTRPRKPYAHRRSSRTFRFFYFAAPISRSPEPMWQQHCFVR